MGGGQGVVRQVSRGEGRVAGAAAAGVVRAAAVCGFCGALTVVQQEALVLLLLLLHQVGPGPVMVPDGVVQWQGVLVLGASQQAWQQQQQAEVQQQREAVAAAAGCGLPRQHMACRHCRSSHRRGVRGAWHAQGAPAMCAASGGSSRHSSSRRSSSSNVAGSFGQCLWLCVVPFTSLPG
jgi:hypothetical protein